LPNGLQTFRPRLYQVSSNPSHTILIGDSEILDRRFPVHAREEKSRQKRSGPRFQNVGWLPRDTFQVSFAQSIKAAQEIGGSCGSPQALQ
jgi:hypothetical protein